MGEGQSKEEGGPPASHGATSNDSMTPAQKAFGDSFKSEKRVEDFPLFTLNMSGQELKYADVRAHHLLPAANGDKLFFEMFWTGELEGLDQEKFKSTVTDVLSKYGGKVIGEMREAGCMISMIAIPFEISEQDAFKLGNAMFADFGEVATKEESHAPTGTN